MKVHLIPRQVPEYFDHEADPQMGTGCPSSWSGFYCTRPEGHKGIHEAMGTGNLVVARWDDDQ